MHPTALPWLCCPLGSSAECSLMEGLRATLKAVLAVRVTSCRLARPQRACAVHLPPPCQLCPSRESGVSRACLVPARAVVWFHPSAYTNAGHLGNTEPRGIATLEVEGRAAARGASPSEQRRVHDVRTPTAILHDTFIRPILALPGLRSVDRVSIAIARPTGPCRLPRCPRVTPSRAPSSPSIGPVDVSASRVRRASLDRHDRCSSSFYPAVRARWAGPFAGPSPRYGAGTARRSTAVERRH